MNKKRCAPLRTHQRTRRLRLVAHLATEESRLVSHWLQRMHPQIERRSRRRHWVRLTCLSSHYRGCHSPFAVLDRIRHSMRLQQPICMSQYQEECQKTMAATWKRSVAFRFSAALTFTSLSGWVLKRVQHPNAQLDLFRGHTSTTPSCKPGEFHPV